MTRGGDLTAFNTRPTEAGKPRLTNFVCSGRTQHGRAKSGGGGTTREGAPRRTNGEQGQGEQQASVHLAGNDNR